MDVQLALQEIERMHESEPNLMKEGSSLYEKEGKRVLEWAVQRRDALTNSD